MDSITFTLNKPESDEITISVSDDKLKGVNGALTKAFPTKVPKIENNTFTLSFRPGITVEEIVTLLQVAKDLRLSVKTYGDKTLVEKAFKKMFNEPARIQDKHIDPQHKGRRVSFGAQTSMLLKDLETNNPSPGTGPELVPGRTGPAKGDKPKEERGRGILPPTKRRW